MFRLLYLTFFGEFRGSKEQEHHLHESPLNMTLPLIVLAILSVVGGFFNLPHFVSHDHSQKLAHWLNKVIISDRITGSKRSYRMDFISHYCCHVLYCMVYCKKYLCKQKKMALPDSKYVGWERLSAQKLKLMRFIMQ